MFVKAETIRTVLVLLALVLILALMGRTAFCALDDWAIWISSSNSSHTSQHLFDPYSFTHFEHGLLFFIFLSWLRIPKLEFAVIIESLWEIAENSSFVINRYRSATAALNYFGDSILNSSGDVLSCVFGFLFARYFGWKIAVALMLVIEIALLLIIKDNLLINVVMLIYPINSLKQWQLGL